tara:strand:- start:7110 stop:8390 length:1281 start_codon:yes stop_codon:yes gene_type:complete
MKAFKYNREDCYFNGDQAANLIGIGAKIDSLKNDSYYDLKKHLLAKEMMIYDLTRPALKMNHLPIIQKIIKRINQLFSKKEQLDINIYIHRRETPEAKATSNQKIFGDKIEFIIILSQHFMNELTFDEQTAVIAHEVAHFYYKHTNVPYSRILNKFKGKDQLSDKIFIQNLRKWSICKEISADLFALQVTKNYESTALALIKFTTGITERSDDVLRDLEGHFKEVRNSNVSEVLKEHPLTLLRVMILKSVFDYFQENGWNVNDQKIQVEIDRQVESVYPEIVYDRMLKDIYLTYELGLLIGIADGKIDPLEISYLCQITYLQKSQIEIENECRKINNQITEQCLGDDSTDRKIIEAQKYIDRRMPNIIKNAEKESNIHISSIIRNLLTLARADGTIDSNELRTIYIFAKKYGYSKGDIVQQMFNLG